MTLQHLLLGAAIVPALMGIAHADPKSQYFDHVRDVRVKPSLTNFVVVDQELWTHTRHDLGDIRLSDNDNYVPYALRVMGSTTITEQHPVQILNKGTIGNVTQCTLDMSGQDVYDEIRLTVQQHDFDRMVVVEGSNTSDSKTWTNLASTPIFDFTRQRLGANLAVSLPTSNFRYLRLSIANDGTDRGNTVQPNQLTAVSAANTSRTTAVWDTIPANVQHAERAGESVYTFDLPSAVPVARLHLTLGEERINFRRPITVEVRTDEPPPASSDTWQTIASTDVSRVRSVRGMLHEDLDIPLPETRAAHWQVIVRNGDDPPLPLRLTPQTLQRRIYFDPKGAEALKLFYGDPKVNAPVYDYDKFFHDGEAKSAVAAAMGSGQPNPTFTARPDDRPWTERHPWVLWAAMALAILGIGSVALRGLKKA